MVLLSLEVVAMSERLQESKFCAKDIIGQGKHWPGNHWVYQTYSAVPAYSAGLWCICGLNKIRLLLLMTCHLNYQPLTHQSHSEG